MISFFNLLIYKITLQPLKNEFNAPIQEVLRKIELHGGERFLQQHFFLTCLHGKKRGKFELL